MKKYLLPKNGNYYKANLHSHTTISDGELTPEEAKEEYKKRGYSVLAYTDHEVMVPHNDLADEEFLPLIGYEMGVWETFEDGKYYMAKTCHMCLIAKDPDMVKQPCFDKRLVPLNGREYIEKLNLYKDMADYERVYTPKCINDMMKCGRDAGFFVIYNHPTWSAETYEQYIHYEQMDAMEIANYTCQREGFEEYNPRVYDDFLKRGRKIYCVGTDDCHKKEDVGGAWIMIKAEKLEYRTIMQALEDGHFYASQGPEIHELWVEDGQLHVVTSDAASILFSCANIQACRIDAEEGKSVNYGAMELNKENSYVRVTVIDHRGRRANTNAYFIE